MKKSQRRAVAPPTAAKAPWPRERVDSWLDFQNKIEPASRSNNVSSGLLYRTRAPPVEPQHTQIGAHPAEL